MNVNNQINGRTVNENTKLTISFNAFRSAGDTAGASTAPPTVNATAAVVEADGAAARLLVWCVAALPFDCVSCVFNTASDDGAASVTASVAATATLLVWFSLSRDCLTPRLDVVFALRGAGAVAHAAMSSALNYTPQTTCVRSAVASACTIRTVSN